MPIEVCTISCSVIHPLNRPFNLVRVLSSELRSLRENICVSCKEKFAPSSSQPEPANFWRHIWRHASPVYSSPTCFGSPTSIDPIPFLSPSHSVSLKPTQSITEQTSKALNNVVSSWSVKQSGTANGILHIKFARSFIYSGQIRSLRFSPDGKHLAALLRSSTRHNTEIIFVDVETGEKTWSVSIYIVISTSHCLDSTLMDYTPRYSSKEKFNVLCMSFCPNGKYLVVGDTAGRVTVRVHVPYPLLFSLLSLFLSHQVWDIPNRRIRNIFKTHSNSVESVDFSPNGQLVASASGDKTVRIWNMRDGSTRVFSDSAQGLWCVAFSPNGQYIVAGNSTGVLMIWNLRTGQLLAKWLGHQRVVLNVAFTPDGKGLVSGSGDGVAKYWDVSSLAIFQASATELLEYKGHTVCLVSVFLNSVMTPVLIECHQMCCNLLRRPMDRLCLL